MLPFTFLSLLLPTGCSNEKAPEQPKTDPITSVLPPLPSVPRQETVVTNPLDEFVNLCDILFSRSDLQSCVTLDQKARSEWPKGKASGLWGYSQGLLDGDTNYSYKEVDDLYGQRLRALQAADEYLVGTGDCPTAGDQSKCFTMIALMRPLGFDFIDDIHNVVGAFELMRATYEAGNQPQQCTMSAATFGTKEAGLCSLYYSHNLLVTPYTVQVRALIKYYQDHAISADQFPPMSNCQ